MKLQGGRGVPGPDRRRKGTGGKRRGRVTKRVEQRPVNRIMTAGREVGLSAELGGWL
jgi:hypothetical protein